MKKRLLSVALTLCMVVTLLPTVTFAKSGSAIQLGANEIGANDKIYFGKYGTYDVPWIVLPSTTLAQTRVADGTNVLPLLSEYLLGTSQFRATNDWGYYNYSIKNGEEDSSILKEKMEDYYNGTNKLFVTAEQNAIADTKLDGDSMDSSQFDLQGQKLFPLSPAEAGSFGRGNNILKAKDRSTPEGEAQWWWLRLSSPNGSHGVCCSPDGTYNTSNLINDTNGVRPAFNLDTSKILFSSAATGGKSAAGMESSLTSVSSKAPTEWKLTLKDDSRSSFSITTTALSDTSATVDYADAKTGTNEYISAVIVDEGNLIYYGRIMQLDGTTNKNSGTVTIHIPAGVTLDTDTTLNVFNEQFNGDRSATDTALMAHTDYASGLETVTAPPPVSTIQLGAGILAAKANTSDAATVYYGKNSSNNPYAWRVIGYDGTGVATADGNMTLIAKENLMQSKFDSYNTSNAYGISTLKEKVEKIAAGLSAKEKLAVAARTLVSGVYTGGSTDCVAGDEVPNALLWPLSTAEAYSLNSSLRVADPEHQDMGTAYWWLRSPGVDNDRVAVMIGSGSVYRDGRIISYEHGVRPAFNLHTSKVLFSSAATGGKAASGMENSLTSVSTKAPTEWKLTLKDSDRQFAAATTAYDSNNKIVTVAYSGATVGTNEYISAIIKDRSGSIIHYGRLKNTAATAEANGTVNIDLSGVTMEATDTLYVFSEQYNGGTNDDTKLTDYASALVEVSLTKNAYSITNTLTNITSSNTSIYRLMSNMSDITPYTATLTAGANHTLPASITVKINSSPLTAGATTYEYNSTNGALTIYAESILGDIEIMAAGVVPHAHSWAAAWATNDTHHWHECEGTGTCPIATDSEKNGYGAHLYDNDRDTTCNTCSYTRTVTPPAPTAYALTTDNSQTGDNSHTLLWILLMLISAGGIAAVGTTQRKRK